LRSVNLSRFISLSLPCEDAAASVSCFAILDVTSL
jgi:hypothetical protein